MRIDTHLHTSHYSRCGKQTSSELLRTAVDAGLEGLIVTDHSPGTRIWPDKEWKQLAAEAADWGLVLFQGVEVGCVDGFDYLVYGSLAFLEAETFHLGKYLEPEDLIKRAHRHGCFVAVAHPYRSEEAVIPERLYQLDLDGVEVKSYNMKTPLQQKLGCQLAHDLGRPGIAGSDAHKQSRVGGYGLELKESARSATELVELLKAGAFTIFEQEPQPCRIACDRRPCEDCNAIDARVHAK